MKDRKLVTIGTITKTHGFEGAVAVKTKNSSVNEPRINEPVFIVVDGIPVPFFVREVYYSGGDTMILAFDDYPDPSSVMMFKGCEVKYESGNRSEDTPEMMEGYTIYDTGSSFRALILSVEEQAGQMLATADFNGREVYIPLHPDLIISVDNIKREIEMSLPDGLADLNS